MVDEVLVYALHRCKFIEDVQNVVFVGEPSIVKIHLVATITVQAIQHFDSRCPTVDHQTNQSTGVEKKAGQACSSPDFRTSKPDQSKILAKGTEKQALSIDEI